MADRLLEAIAALYGGDSNRQHAASEWLNQFFEHPEAPKHALDVLKPEQPEHVQFFLANLLLSCVRLHWTKIPPTLQQTLREQIRQEIWANVTDPKKLSELAFGRLVSARACIATKSGPEDIHSCMKDAMNCASKGNMLVALELSVAVGEQCRSVHRIQRPKIVSEAIKSSTWVFQLVLKALQASTSVQTTRIAVQCLNNWLFLKDSELAETLMSPAQFLERQPELLVTALNHVMHPDEQVSTSATTFVAGLFGSPDNIEDEKAERDAIQWAAEKVLGMGSSHQLGNTGHHHLARISSRLADRDPAALAGAIPQADSLAQMMVDTVRCGHHGAAECAMDYFETINSMYLAERTRFLRKPVYKALLQALLETARYPTDFTTWDDCADLDKDAFHDFRNNVMESSFETCRNVLAMQYIEALARSLGTAASWQQIEAIIFAMRPLEHDFHLDAEEDRLIVSLLQHLMSSSAIVGAKGGSLVQGILHLIASCNRWFVQSSTGLVQPALEIVVGGIRDPDCCELACPALASLCQAYSKGLAAQLLPELLSSIVPLLIGANGPSLESKEALVKALVKLIECASLDRLQAGEQALNIAKPMIDRTKQLGQSPGEVAAKCLADELHLMGSLIHRLDFLVFEANPSDPSPAFATFWEAVQAINTMSKESSQLGDKQCAASLCKLLGAGITASGTHGEEAVKIALPLLGKLFGNSPQSCLEVILAALQTCENSQSIQVVLGNVMAQLCPSLTTALQAPELDPDLGAAIFAVLVQCLAVRANPPSPLQDSIRSSIPQFLSQAMLFLGRLEEALLKQCLEFIRQCLMAGEQATLVVVQTWMQEHGALFVTSVLRSACCTFPASLMRRLAGLLLLVLRNDRYQPHAHQWVEGAMSQDPEIVKALTLDIRIKICQLLLKMDSCMSGQFGCLMRDMAAIARLESGPDVLLAYELG